MRKGLSLVACPHGGDVCVTEKSKRVPMHNAVYEGTLLKI